MTEQNRDPFRCFICKTLFCLADFVAPKAAGQKDHLGGFVVTAGPEVEEIAAKYEADHDDYTSIMIKALGDRIAEQAMAQAGGTLEALQPVAVG